METDEAMEHLDEMLYLAVSKGWKVDASLEQAFRNIVKRGDTFPLLRADGHIVIHPDHRYADEFSELSLESFGVYGDDNKIHFNNYIDLE